MLRSNPMPMPMPMLLFFLANHRGSRMEKSRRKKSRIPSASKSVRLGIARATQRRIGIQIGRRDALEESSTPLLSSPLESHIFPRESFKEMIEMDSRQAIE